MLFIYNIVKKMVTEIKVNFDNHSLLNIVLLQT